MERRITTATIEKHEGRGETGSVQSVGPQGAWNEAEAIGQIKLLSSAAEQLAHESVERAKITVQTAAECGLWLQLAKKNLPYGEFDKWIQVNFVLTKRTATRYMLLASKIGHVSHLADWDYPTLRQAYIISGVVKPTETQQPEETEGSNVGHVSIPVALPSALLPFQRWHRKVYKEQLPTASRHQLEEWLKELKEAHDTYLEIQIKLLR